MPFVSPHNIPVSAINGAGAVIEIIYVFIFVWFAPKKEKIKVLSLFSFVVTAFGGVVLVSMLALHAHSRTIFCGFAAAIFSIIMYGSPLSIMVSYVHTFYIKFSCLCTKYYVLNSCVCFSHPYHLFMAYGQLGPAFLVSLSCFSNLLFMLSFVVNCNHCFSLIFLTTIVN